MNLHLNDFLVEYNELLSRVALGHRGEFSSLSSPTLNKQEKATFLYRDIVNQINSHARKITKINPVRLRLEFIARLSLIILYLVKNFNKIFPFNACIFKKEEKQKFYFEEKKT